MDKIFIVGIVASGKTTLAKSYQSNSISHGMNLIVSYIKKHPKGEKNATRKSKWKLFMKLTAKGDGFLKERTGNLISACMTWRIRLFFGPAFMETQDKDRDPVHETKDRY